MVSNPISIEIKSVLEQVNNPSCLDSHPWVGSLLVRQFVTEGSASHGNNPGYQLLTALGELFRETMPGTPPRKGVRPDTQWGRFGILAALYFAPFEHGTVRPISLLDAWGRIDQVLPMFVFEEADHQLPAKDLERYRLIGDEYEAVPTSTLSDWHMRGLEHLAEVFIDRERMLGARLNEPSIVLSPSDTEDVDNERRNILQALNPLSAYVKSRFQFFQTRFRLNQRLIWIALLSGLLLFLGWKAWRVIALARAVQADAQELQAFVTNPGELGPETIAEVGPLLGQARTNIENLDKIAQPFLWTGHLLAWVPVYGPDLKSAKPLLDLAAGVIVAADETYSGLLPLIEKWSDEDTFLSPAGILGMLEDAQPGLTEAYAAVESATSARAMINIDRLSPHTSQLMEKLDPFLPLLENGLLAAKAAPRVLGGHEYGPQTYLVLLQNEDELRATGGFITSVGVITVENAEVSSYSLVDSYDIDDPEKSAHTPPWQLYAYMRTGFWYIRDANWSPDFPTTAEWAERLYVYHKSHAVDGVIAIDQEAIRILLEALGPVDIESSGQSITADNIIQYMRDAKSGIENESTSGSYVKHRKDFLQPLARALLEKLEDPTLSIAELAKTVSRALDERHILMQLDDPDATSVLSSRSWDGAIKPDLGDFLMVVDSNLGFNKANAVVEQTIQYEVDLTDLENPIGTLSITHTNSALGDSDCNHRAYYHISDYTELIHRCYWDYLRVYTLEDVELIGATPHRVSGKWMLREKTIPAQVDDLTNNYIMPERIPGIRAFGTLLVVPNGKTVETCFEFGLPSSIISPGDEGKLIYRLTVQKQPGTDALPVEITVNLPNGVQDVDANLEGIHYQNYWHFNGFLLQDVDIILVFSLP